MADPIMSIPFLAFCIVSAVLALPALRQETNYKRFARAWLVSAFGVVLPVTVFFLGAFLVPDWKGDCVYGWVDCFHLGKLALTPFVIWATISLYVLELFPDRSRTRQTVALGVFIGAIIASVCFLFGLFVVPGQRSDFVLWLLVPLYIAFWHTWHALHLLKEQGWKPIPYLLTFLGSIPFWIGSILWSRQVYESSPNNPPDCFIVTAANRGHGRLVGPFAEIVRHDRTRPANQQLIRFWELENTWAKSSPHTHKLFRAFYNKWGPHIARRIASPWAADAVYLMLKPFEFAARILVAVLPKSQICHTYGVRKNGANR